MGLKVSKNVILPRIDKIQDPETKRVMQELLKVIQDMNSTYYNDLVYLSEEGIWTMGVSFGGGITGITYSANTGHYTKIGNIVTISGLMYLTSKGSSVGNALITGLPFKVANNDAGIAAVTLRFSGITFVGQFQGCTLINTTTIELTEITEAGNITTLTNTDFINSSHIMVNCTYRTE